MYSHNRRLSCGLGIKSCLLCLLMPQKRPREEFSRLLALTYPLEAQCPNHQKPHLGSERCHYGHKTCLQQNPGGKQSEKLIHLYSVPEQKTLHDYEEFTDIMTDPGHSSASPVTLQQCGRSSCPNRGNFWIAQNQQSCFYTQPSSMGALLGRQ